MYFLEPVTTINCRCSVALPVLAGETEETLFRNARPAGASGEFELKKEGRWTVGYASVPIQADLDSATNQLYAMLFAAVERLHLCRVWHFVPRINETGADGLENYRAFCQGRSLAFERKYGAGFKRLLPSASAVGTDDERLTFVFAACAIGPRHFENPEQVPAYKYPKKHGPRPPSFSRATLVPAEAGADVFISGTAAIQGHETVAPGDTAGQIVRTLHNLRTIAQKCGLGDDLGRTRGGVRHFKVYLRHRADLAGVKQALEQSLLDATDKVTYLRADICRAELNLEIEATLLGLKTG